MREQSPVRIFSTTTAKPQDSAELWQEYMARVYYDLEITPSADRVIGTIKEVRLEAISVSSVQVGAQRVIRRKTSKTSAEEEFFVICLSRAASFQFQQNGRSTELQPGGAVLLNTSGYYRCDVPDGSDNITLKIPCHLLRARLSWIDDGCACAELADRSLVPFVDGLATQMLSMPLMDRPVVQGLEDACLDLVAVMMEAGRGSLAGADTSAELPDLMIRRLLAFVDRHLGRSDLRAADAATACGVSERQVQRLLQRRGTTFRSALLAARLRRADDLLGNAVGKGCSIGEIAFACGFVSQAHFSSRYHDHFGLRPRDRRAQLRRMTS